MLKSSIRICLIAALSFTFASCEAPKIGKRKPRLSMFIGVDISGSYLNGPYFKDSMRFLSHYIHSHLRGLGGLEVPKTLFVGSIGGSTISEPKTFYPIQTFQDKSPAEIEKTLLEIFPKDKQNPYTDYNAFFNRIESFVINKKLALRPISIVMVSDGVPDVKTEQGKRSYDFSKIDVSGLERLARSVTIRLLYTDAVVGDGWQGKIPRRKLKVWTQDAKVMTQWKDKKILIPGKRLEDQEKFFAWLKDNVDFAVRSRRID